MGTQLTGLYFIQPSILHCTVIRHRPHVTAAAIIMPHNDMVVQAPKPPGLCVCEITYVCVCVCVCVCLSVCLSVRLYVAMQGLRTLPTDVLRCILGGSPLQNPVFDLIIQLWASNISSRFRGKSCVLDSQRQLTAPWLPLLSKELNDKSSLWLDFLSTGKTVFTDRYPHVAKSCPL